VSLLDLKRKIKGGKDTALSVMVKKAVNIKIKEIGEMVEFKLDSIGKTIECEVMLKGEKEPLKVHVGSYSLYVDSDGKTKMRVEDIVTSREWINTVLSTAMVPKEFELSEEVAKILSVLI